MNAIAKTEARLAEIANRTDVEPVLPFRIYTITKSERHLIAGSDFQLAMSFETREEAEAELAKGADSDCIDLDPSFGMGVIIEGPAVNMAGYRRRQELYAALTA